MKSFSRLKKQFQQTDTFIFDLDGTVVNSDELNFQVYKSVITDSFELTLTRNEFKQFFLGSSTEKAFCGYLSQVEASKVSSVDLDLLIKRFLLLKNEFLLNNIAKYVTIKPYAYEFITSLQKAGYKTALATSTERDITRTILHYFELWHMFDIILTSDEIMNGKPNPEIFDVCLDILKTEPSEAVVFEDSPNGVLASERAGVFCVGMEIPGFNSESIQLADSVITDFEVPYNLMFKTDFLKSDKTTKKNEFDLLNY